MKIWKIRQKSTGLFWNNVRWAKLEGSFAEIIAHELDDDREMVHLVAQASVAAPEIPRDNPNNYKYGDRVTCTGPASSKELTGFVVETFGVEVGIELDPGQFMPPRNNGQPWKIHYKSLQPETVRFAHTYPVNRGPRPTSYPATWNINNAYVVNKISGSFDVSSPQGPHPQDHPYWPKEYHPGTNETLIKGEIKQVTQTKRNGMPIAGENILEGKFYTSSGSSVEGTYIGSPGSHWVWETFTVSQ